MLGLAHPQQHTSCGRRFLFWCQVPLNQEPPQRTANGGFKQIACVELHGPSSREVIEETKDLPLGPKHTFLTRQRSPNSFPLKCNPTARGFVYSKARWTAAQKLVSPCAPGGWGARGAQRTHVDRGPLAPSLPCEDTQNNAQSRKGSFAVRSSIWGHSNQIHRPSIQGLDSTSVLPTPSVWEPPAKSSP